jgi:hypothetical protein
LQPPRIKFDPFELDKFVGIFVLDEPFQIDVSNVNETNLIHVYIINHIAVELQKLFGITFCALKDVLHYYNNLVHSA